MGRPKLSMSEDFCEDILLFIQLPLFKIGRQDRFQSYPIGRESYPYGLRLFGSEYVNLTQLFKNVINIF